jgi:hypothetical protein
MANARTRFDTIRDYLLRAHDARMGTFFGRPCSISGGETFIVLTLYGMCFRLRGRVRLQALALAGAKFWDPMERGNPEMDWVFVPEAHFLRWDRFAVESLRVLREGTGVRGVGGGAQAFSKEAIPEPKPPPQIVVQKKWSFSSLLSLVPLIGRKESIEPDKQSAFR